MRKTIPEQIAANKRSSVVLVIVLLIFAPGGLVGLWKRLVGRLGGGRTGA